MRGPAVRRAARDLSFSGGRSPDGAAAAGPVLCFDGARGGSRRTQPIDAAGRRLGLRLRQHRGRARAPHSDIDVGLLLDRRTHPSPRARFDAQLDLRRTLSPAVIGRELDVVVLNDASPLIGRRVVQDGVRVYVADAEADHAFRRDVQLRAADLDPFIRRMRRLTLDALAR